MLALHLLQISLVYINTLMIQEEFKDSDWQKRLTKEDYRGLTPLFYSHVKREAALQKRDDLLNELGRLFIEGILNEKMFDELVNLVNRTTLGLATLPPDEASRVKYMEALIHKRLSPVSFEVAWNALERLQVKPSSPAKLL